MNKYKNKKIGCPKLYSSSSSVYRGGGGEADGGVFTTKSKNSLPPSGRAVKFFTFCHPELAKDLPPQRKILAGDASLPLSMTVRLFIMTEWFPEVMKATKGQKMENLTALPLRGTPSINRGRAKILSASGKLFNHSI